MGSAASSLPPDDPHSMSLNPSTSNHQQETQRSSNPSSSFGATRHDADHRPSLTGLSVPFSKVDLTSSSSTVSEYESRHTRTRHRNAQVEREEGEISDDDDDDGGNDENSVVVVVEPTNSNTSIRSLPGPSRSSGLPNKHPRGGGKRGRPSPAPIPPRGQPIDRTVDRERDRERDRLRARGRGTPRGRGGRGAPIPPPPPRGGGGGGGGRGGASGGRVTDHVFHDQGQRQASFGDRNRPSDISPRRSSPPRQPLYPPPASQSAPVSPYTHGPVQPPPPVHPYPGYQYPSSFHPPPASLHNQLNAPSGPRYPVPHGSQQIFRPPPIDSSTPASVPSSSRSSFVTPMPAPVAAAPEDISPDEAQQYMSIIRNLLQEGFTPELLVERGATPKYVTAVCQEIVEAQQHRKSIWMGTNAIAGPSRPVTSTNPPLVAASSVHPNTRRSPSPTVKVRQSIPMDRGSSLSSEGSAEIVLLEDSPPRHQGLPASYPPPRLVPSSHWAPQPSSSNPPPSIPPPAVAATFSALSAPVPPSNLAPPIRPFTAPLAAAPRAIKIESYKPASPVPIPDIPAGNTHRPSQISVNGKVPPSGPRSSTGLHRRGSNHALSVPSVQVDSGSASPNKRPRHLSPERERIAHSPTSVIPVQSAAIAPQVVITPANQHGRSPSLSSGSSRHPLPEKPSLELFLEPDLTKYDSQPSFVPSLVPSTRTTVAADLAAKHAILETRRKALESMRARRAQKSTKRMAGSASPMDVEVDMEIDVDVASENPVSAAADAALEEAADAAAQKSIEDEVADLEQEVMGYESVLAKQAAAAEVTSNDAETKSSAPPTALEDQTKTEFVDMDVDSDEPEEGELSPDPVEPTPDVPIRRVRGRPAAEDLDSRPVSAPVRTRRKPFGAPQRANKLILALDDDSESDSEPETSNDQAERRAEILKRLAEEKQNTPIPLQLTLSSEGTTDSRGAGQSKLLALAEQEEKIRLLKEQIALKLKAKEAARLRAALEGRGKSEGQSSRESTAGVEERTDSAREGSLVKPTIDVGIKQEAVESAADVDAVETGESGRADDERGVETPEGRQFYANKDNSALPLPPADISITRPTAPDVGHQISPLDDRLPFAVPVAPAPVPFAPYQGITSRYPQLFHDRAAIKQARDGRVAVDITSEHEQDDPLLVPQRNILRGIMLTRITHDQPDASMCAAEVGGGTCADPSCDAVHFHLELDPTGERDLNQRLLMRPGK
ncbi:hypothetical protein BD324DRAFT_634373 [Kockovaella imperatae]|uniref:Uncharacterized protein n=1 Tax=Kockovaella imperatae TaxID=4999 RepID=A0A1Y1U9E8_9TREE|nr:hypothetical protein BD324DRAFT_634373 [Kockovaella imperatae]ORX34659.1 hypothetical protein BD324DRAFT_634373 [Kockovaella imperatae]